MCGIFGAITKTGLPDSLLRVISRDLSHRGPDGEGILRVNLDNRVLDFVHRRLSIIDLSSRARQPMLSEDNTVVIVYNGEIYNYQEIRQELLEKGYRFDSDSDTEVVLKSYLQWGIDCLQRFIGMFAFAILDKNKKKLFLFRDHVGKKPLYYYLGNGTFMFASELKSFLACPEFSKEIDLEAVTLYFLLGYIPSPFCIFKKTRKLPPGYFLEADLEGNIQLKKWWDLDHYYKQKKNDLSFNETKQVLKEKLLDAFKYRLIADVPVGVFLSGGIDSTLITTLLQKNIRYPLKTFTISFREKEYDESVWAKNIAEFLGTQHTQLLCTPAEAKGVIRQISEINDEPFADSSTIPTYLVSKLSGQHVKVCLSGDGGDELFGGYDRYTKIDILCRFLSLPLILREGLIKGLGFLKSLNFIEEDDVYKLFSILKSKNFSQSYLSLSSYWNPLQLEKLLKSGSFSKLSFADQEYPGASCSEKAMFWDFKYYLSDDLLAKVDRASMANSLEVRCPILDRRVCEFVFTVPLRYRFRKRILKSIISEYLPEKLFLRPKRGFVVPVYEWLKADLRDLFREYLSPARLSVHDFLNTEYLISVADKYQRQGNVSIHKLWAALIFQLWYERWMS